MIDKQLLVAFSYDLGIKSHLVESDIKDLAWCWELALGESKTTAPEAIHEILSTLTRAYLRGRDRRMGNWQGYLKHRYTQIALFVLIVQHVIEEPIVYEALHKAGVTSEEAYLSIKRQAVKGILGLDGDILQEAKRILKSKQDNSGKNTR